MRPYVRYGALFCALAIPLVATPSRAAPLEDSAPPALNVIPLRHQPGSPSPRPLLPSDRLQPREPGYLDIAVDRPAYVAAVLYAPGGRSRVLTPNGSERHLAPGQTLRVSVPRRAPPGVAETALQVFVYASPQPLSPLLSSLLHLPCPNGDTDGRGDPQPEQPPPRKPDPPAKSESGGPPSRPASGDGRPIETPPRGSSPIPLLCTTAAGVSPPVTLRAVRFVSE